MRKPIQNPLYTDTITPNRVFLNYNVYAKDLDAVANSLWNSLQ
jgi:hypothetical protein